MIVVKKAGVKPVIFVNDRIIIGCENFTIEELDRIREQYSVPDELVEYFRPYYTGEQSSYESMAEYLTHSNWAVRAAIARYGNDELRDQLLDDKDYFVRLEVAVNGNKDQCESLLTDDDKCVVEAAIERLETLTDEKEDGQ